MRQNTKALTVSAVVKVLFGSMAFQASPARAFVIQIPLAESIAYHDVTAFPGGTTGYISYTNTGPGNSFDASPRGSTYSFSAQAIVSPNPSRPYTGSPSVSVSATAGSGDEVDAGAEVDYYFVISSSLALTNPAAVGIDVTGTEYASGGFYSYYSIYSDESDLGANFSPTDNGVAILNQNKTFVQLTPNILYTATISAEVVACGSSSTLHCENLPSSGNAYVDPYFTLDPSTLAEFPDAQILLSADVPNFPDGVPEPSSWGLMLLGLGAIGWRIRRSLGDRAMSPRQSLTH